MSQRRAVHDVLVGIQTAFASAGINAQVAQQRFRRGKERPGTGDHNCIDDAWGEARIQKHLADRGTGEEAQVRGVQQPFGRVLEIPLQDGRDQEMVLQVRDGAQNDPLRVEKSAIADQKFLRCYQVFEDVAVKDAVEASWLDGRILALDIERKHVIQACFGAFGDGRLTLDAEYGSLRVDVLESASEVPFGAADFQDPLRARRYGAEQELVTTRVIASRFFRVCSGDVC